MKKTILTILAMLGFVCIRALGIVCIIGLGISCLAGWGNTINKITTKVEDAFSDLYEVERLDVISEDGSYYNSTIRKMKANDMDFYFITYNRGNGLPSGDTYIFTSILSSVYEKYQNQIKNSASKYQIDVSFNFTADNYKEEDYFFDCRACKHFITININSYQKDNLTKFIDEILAIEEINNLYEKWVSDGGYEYRGREFFVYDYSDIFFDGNEYSTSSIFKYYYENRK